MKLDRNSVDANRDRLKAAGYKLPEFDYEKVREATLKTPEWIHFGAGNIFRAFIANVCQGLINDGALATGLIAAEGYDYEIVEKSYRPCDDLSILATLKADSTVEKTVIGSIVRSLVLDRGNEEDFESLRNIFRNPSLKMASFTITEKGYAVRDAKGDILPRIHEDFMAGPGKSESYLGKVFSLLYDRYLAGKSPVAMVSMDNCSHNGDKLREAALSFAKAWCEGGLAEEGFLDYVNDPGSVSFPWTMIDKITPRPDEKVMKILTDDGIEDLEPVVTSMNTWTSPFVNAEECQYLIIEDAFPGGRLPLDKGGIIYTDRQTVDRVEKMKVGTCLNPLHTTLAIFGCLLGYTKISDEMKDEQLKALVDQVGYKEGLPVVTDPGIINPSDFIDEVVNLRIPNPFMPDTPQRIACDTSQKLPIRFGGTIRAYMSSDEHDVKDLKAIPLVYAGWLRYLMALDDEGNAFEPSPDPLLEKAQEYVKGFSLSEEEKDLSLLDGLLSNSQVFGVDLGEAGLADKVKDYFVRLSAGKGAVRRTLSEEYR